MADSNSTVSNEISTASVLLTAGALAAGAGLLVGFLARMNQQANLANPARQQRLQTQAWYQTMFSPFFAGMTELENEMDPGAGVKWGVGAAALLSIPIAVMVAEGILPSIPSPVSDYSSRPSEDPKRAAMRSDILQRVDQVLAGLPTRQAVGEARPQELRSWVGELQKLRGLLSRPITDADLRQVGVRLESALDGIIATATGNYTPSVDVQAAKTQVAQRISEFLQQPH